jgi:hypothetical protein
MSDAEVLEQLGRSIRCLRPGCERVRFRRGLCGACRQKLRRDILAGKTTEAAETAAGRLLAVAPSDFGERRYSGATE